MDLRGWGRRGVPLGRTQGRQGRGPADGPVRRRAARTGVFSRADYLFTDVAHTGAGPAPSDVAYMAEALFLPYWFWGLFCGGLSLAILWAGLHRFVKATR